MKTDSRNVSRGLAALCFVIALQTLTFGCGDTRPVKTDPPPAEPPEEYEHYRFVSGDCSDQKYCVGERQAKPWASDERRVVIAAIDEILKAQRGRMVVTATQNLGVVKLRRYNFGVNQTSAGPVLTKTANATYIRDHKAIDITDALFEKSFMRDQRSGYRLQARILLHELFHVVDDLGRIYSLQDPFLQSSGFGFDKDDNWLPQEITDTQRARLAGAWARMEEAIRAGRVEDAWNFGRTIGITELSMPSLQSMNNPWEGFAEIGAHLVLDHTARSYLRPTVVNFFERQVFPKLEGDQP